MALNLAIQISKSMKTCPQIINQTVRMKSR